MDKVFALDALIEKNLGYLKTSEAVEAGISRASLDNYVCSNHLERVSFGLYRSQDAWDDEMFVLQTRYPKAVFSHETAQFLLGLADREPDHYSITLKTGTSSSNLAREGIRVHKVKADLFDIGLAEAQSPFGHSLHAYNAERTICDLVRGRSAVEIQDMQAALKGYVRQREKNIPLLMRYAKVFSVEKTVTCYLEMLL